jgi:hypothetical protein
MARSPLHVLVMVGMAVILAATLSAQAPPARGNAPPPARQGQPPNRPQPTGVTVGELQQLLDAMELTRARTVLELSDEQFSRFLPKLEALQAVRRRAEIERTRAVNELRRMTQAGDPNLDERMRERLAEITAIDARAFAEQQRALESINEVLTLRQQALFRVFEEQMERQKADLLTRTRQANRPPANRF